MVALSGKKKRNHNRPHKKVYQRRLTRIAISIDYLLRIRLGLDPNPRGLRVPLPVPEDECIDFLKNICEAYESSHDECTIDGYEREWDGDSLDESIESVPSVAMDSD